MLILNSRREILISDEYLPDMRMVKFPGGGMEYGEGTSDKTFDFPELINGQQAFRWVSLAEIKEDDLSFPVDKKVIGLLKNKFFDGS